MPLNKLQKEHMWSLSFFIIIVIYLKSFIGGT